MIYIFLFFSSLALSLIFTLLVWSLAQKLNIYDVPFGLKKHERPIPYLGGIAVYLAFIIPLIAERLYTIGNIAGIGSIILGAAIILIMGLIDDLKPLSIPLKFFIQTICALILVIHGIKINVFQYELFNIIITLFWVVGIANAFNIIDIMDGLCSGVGIIASFTFFIFAVLTGKIFSPSIAICLAGSLLGFLRYNYPPAKIYLGDAGSLSIGFILSALAMAETYSGTNVIAILSPVLILGIPISDTLFVMIMRQKQGKSMFFGSPDHFPLRMKAMGFSIKQVIRRVYITAGILCLLAFLSTKVNIISAVSIYIVVFIWIAGFLRKLSKIRMD